MSEYHHPNYFRVWGILVVLLVISVLGPLIGIKLITLVTAFGIAIIKAYMVAKNFMHLNVERRYVVYMLVTVLTFMGLFFAGVAGDVMKHEGSGWTKPSFGVTTGGAITRAHTEQSTGHE